MSSNKPLTIEEWWQLARLLERWQRQAGVSWRVYGMITLLLGQAMQEYVTAPAQPLLTGKYPASSRGRTCASEESA